MELILGAMIVALWVKALPAAMVDMVTMLRASKAGEWGLIDKERDRKHQRAASRREAMSKAWQATRASRNKKAGGDGVYRPGAKAYLGDVYHGLWEDKLEKRHAKRAARPPYDPSKPRRRDRVDAAVEAKVDGQRRKSGRFGRAARLLLDPVGEKRQPADVVPSAPDVRDTGNGGVYGQPSDPWAPTGGGDEPTMDLGDGPRIACPVCGDTLTEKQPGQWEHPVGSACEAASQPAAVRPATGKDPVPGCYHHEHRRRGEDESTTRHPSDVIDDNPAPQVPTSKTASGDIDQQNTKTVTNSGGTTMSDSDLLTYNQAVAEHEAALQHLLAQRAEAAEFKQHLTGSTAAVENMDAGRDKLAQALAPLAEGMEGSRFGSDASSGSADAAGALSAGSIAAVQEHIEAANDTNDRWITELDASIEAVQASMQSLQSTYGEAAATVQETGVDARALAEH